MTKHKNPYKIGYGKPPKATQFVKGQSGNPHGRKKGTKNLPALFKELLAEEITVLEGGKEKRISSQEAIARRIRAEALKGKEKAIERILQYAPVNEDEETTFTFGQFLEKLNWDRMNDQEFDIVVKLFGMEKQVDDFQKKMDKFFATSPKQGKPKVKFTRKA
jgi:hypothetical protein